MAQSSRLGRIVLAGLSALILVLSVTGWAASEKYLSALKTVDVFGGLAGSSAWTGQPVNVLLVGSDDRSRLTAQQRRETRISHEDFGRHTDTLLLLHIGGDLGRVTVVSIPRDSLVDIPEHVADDGTVVPAHKGKVNSAFASGGPAVTVKTVEQATGVHIDHYMEIDFGGFLNMVDAVGGVEVCLDQPISDYHSKLNLPAGRQTIQGPQALAYVRARYIDNDFGRSKRQQKFLSAMAQKVSAAQTLLNPVALNGFLDAVASSITTDERLARDDMAALAARAADLDLSKITFTTVPVSDGDHKLDGESTVLWDSVGAPALFAALRDDRPLPKPVPATAVEIAPGDISVAVNGPSAQRAAADLRAAGYQVASVTQASSSAPSTGYSTTGGESGYPSASASNGSPDSGGTAATGSAGTGAPAAVGITIAYDPQWPKSLESLKASFPGAQLQSRPGIGATFQVTVGSDYAGLSPVRSASTGVEASERSAKDNICS